LTFGPIWPRFCPVGLSVGICNIHAEPKILVINKMKWYENL